jgi:hypothetical protein
MRTAILPDKKEMSFDYEKQVWIAQGVYQRCGHPESMDCRCYGKIHAGEEAVITDACQ